MKFTPKQYQRVLDSFAVGRLMDVRRLATKVVAVDSCGQEIFQAFVETTQGVFLLVYYPDEPLLVYGPGRELRLITRLCKLKNALPLKHASQEAFGTHKYHYFFRLFAL
jgi:hypothetical protein